MIPIIKKYLKTKNQGFTLVELLLYMGIFSILIIVLLQMFFSIFDSQIDSQSSSSIITDGQFILNRFKYDVENAKSIVVPPAPGSSGTSAQLVINNKSYSYSLINGNVILTNSTSGTSDQLNSVNTTASNLNFLRLSDTKGKNIDTLTISVTLTSNIVKNGVPTTENFKTTVGVRPKQ